MDVVERAWVGLHQYVFNATRICVCHLKTDMLCYIKPTGQADTEIEYKLCDIGHSSQ